MSAEYGRHVMPCSLLLILSCVLAIAGCSDDYKIVGVGSQGPGILQVIMKSDDADSILVIAGDSARVTEGSGDSLALSVSQGRAFRGADYATLYGSLQDYLQLIKTYNPIRKQSGTYQSLLLFQSYLPPANYDSLTFELNASYLQIGYYQIPLSPVQGAGDFVTFIQSFRIEEGRTTVVTLHVKPLSSLVRVGDSFQYSWIFDLVQITYP